MTSIEPPPADTIELTPAEVLRSAFLRDKDGFLSNELGFATRQSSRGMGVLAVYTAPIQGIDFECYKRAMNVASFLPKRPGDQNPSSMFLNFYSPELLLDEGASWKTAVVSPESYAPLIYPSNELKIIQDASAQKWTPDEIAEAVIDRFRTNITEKEKYVKKSKDTIERSYLRYLKTAVSKLGLSEFLWPPKPK